MKNLRQAHFLAILIATIVFFGCEKDDDKKTVINDIVDTKFNINMNPYGNTPMTGIVDMDAKKGGDYTIQLMEGDGYTYSGEFYQGDNELPVKGLYAGQDNTINIALETETSMWDTTVVITVEELPDFFPNIDIVKSNSSIDQDWILCEFSAAQGTFYNTYPFIMDLEGNIRWYSHIEELDRLVYPIRQNLEGDFIMGNDNRVKLMDLTGNIVHEFNLGGFNHHHESFQSADGNYIFAVNVPGESRVEDHIIKTTPNGDILQEWNMRDILDVDRTDLVDHRPDWFHMNAIFETADQDLIISGRNQGVVKVDKDNNLQWILAPHKGWTSKTEDFLLTAIDSNGDPYSEDVQQGTSNATDFDWTWGQHAPMLLENGNLLVFDNGFNRQFNSNPTYSRAVEYEIDEENGTVRQVWQYGKERGVDFQSIIISDVDELSNGEIMITSGFSPDVKSDIVVVDYNTREEKFEVRLNHKNTNGSGDGSWGSSDIVYRAQKVKF